MTAGKRNHPFKIDFKAFSLDNGLSVILHEDHRLPQVAVNIWYHVGSKNESPGKTGFAHLFEHLMFQGSEHSKQDYFKPLEEIGARLNGSTSEDRTNYWEVVPVSYLERALWLEADRMGWLPGAITLEKLNNQREVVKNERRQTMDNQPYGAAEETMLALLYPEGHPYHHSIIGSMEDLDAATLDDVKDFFRRFYTPRNASLCIAGDMEIPEALGLARKYFGEIPGGPVVAPIEPSPPILSKRRRVKLEDRVALERIYMEWPTVPHLSNEGAALDVLSFILSTGKDSRLGNRLQLKEQVAQSFWSYQGGGELAGSFQVAVTVQRGKSVEKVEEACRSELRNLIRNGVSEGEVEGAINGLTTGVLKRIQQLGGFGGVSDMLNYYQTFLGTPAGLEVELERYSRIGPEDVRAVAERYLDPDRYAFLGISPEEPDSTSIDRTIMPGKGRDSTFSFPSFDRKTLDNGLNVWVLNDSHVPMVTAKFLSRSGSSSDPEDKPGIAHFCAGLMDEAAAGKDTLEIAGIQKRLGAPLATTINRDHSTFTISLMKEKLSEGLSFMGDVILRPDFREEDAARLRQEMRAGLVRNLDDPAELGDRTLWARLFGERSPYGHPIEGGPSLLNTFTAADAREFHAGNYHPESSLFVIVGDISTEEAMREVEGVFGGWRSDRSVEVEEFSENPSTGLYIVDKPSAKQSYITSAMPTVTNLDPLFPALVIFNAVFGGQFVSRINMNLREDKGYTYGAVSQLELTSGILPWTMRTSVQSDKTLESLIEMKKELTGILEDMPVTRKEFVSARDNYLLKYPQRFETQGQLAAGLANLWVYGLPDDYHQELVRRIGSLTPEEVNDAGRKAMNSEKSVWVVVGDSASLIDTLEKSGLGKPQETKAPGQGED